MKVTAIASRTLPILYLLACGATVSAQSWDTVRALRTGDRIQVQDGEGKRQSGTLASVSADAITLQTPKGSLSIDRPRVRKVKVRSNSVRLRNILIGSGIGVAIGATVDQTAGTYLRNESGENQGARAVTYIAPIALIGGMCAFPAYRTIYKTP